MNKSSAVRRGSEKAPKMFFGTFINEFGRYSAVFIGPEFSGFNENIRY
ncbi:MAG: hypothetical protein RLZZ205_1268, partial [Bacteroidota bacterium]